MTRENFCGCRLIRVASQRHAVRHAGPRLGAGSVPAIALYKFGWMPIPPPQGASQSKANQSQETSRRRRSMAGQYVGKIAEFKDGDRGIIFAGDTETGIFRHERHVYANSDFCLL